MRLNEAVVELVSGLFLHENTCIGFLIIVNGFYNDNIVALGGKWGKTIH